MDCRFGHKVIYLLSEQGVPGRDWVGGGGRRKLEGTSREERLRELRPCWISFLIALRILFGAGRVRLGWLAALAKRREIPGELFDVPLSCS